jgi:hypothetical protein
MTRLSNLGEPFHFAKWFEFHLATKHRSYLIMVKIEISALNHQCLGRHIRDQELMTSGVGAWQDEINDQAVTLQLRFLTADSRIKLRLISLYIFFTKYKLINFSSY